MKTRDAPLRVIVDASLWIAYLLPSSLEDRTVDRLLALFLQGSATLVIPDDLVVELRRTVSQKPYLMQRIRPDQFDWFVAIMYSVGEALPAMDERIPRLTRDPKDDYLLAAAVVADVDILVSGDADLLALREHLDRPRIMTARELIDAFEPE